MEDQPLQGKVYIFSDRKNPQDGVSGGNTHLSKGRPRGEQQGEGRLLGLSDHS